MIVEQDINHKGLTEGLSHLPHAYFFITFLVLVISSYPA